MADAILLANAAATWALVGLIWFVQVVHYPLFARVGDGGFVRYADAHSRLTTRVVGPPMLVEAASATLLLVRRPAGCSLALVVAGLVLVGVLWAATALLSVPQHRALGAGWDARAYWLLVATNWVRTAAWTVRGAIVLALLAQAL